MADTVAHLVRPDDPSLVSESIQYQAKSGDVKGYLSRPKDGGRRGAVIVIHENRGLVDHIRDVARRFATDGFVALAPDLLTHSGGTDLYKTPDDAIAAIRRLTNDMVAADLHGAVAYLRKLDVVNGRVGVVGYCWGGGQSLSFATRCKELAAAVVYYGRNPDPVDEVQNIACPVLGNYGEDDPNIMPGVEPLKQALARFNRQFDIKVYPGAKHAFNNNTNPERYHPEAARDAWARTVDFFKRNLGG